jgi:hypothetical protein
MKYIKRFQIFESTWSYEEFVQELSYYLGQYNLSAVYIREIINKLDIQSEIESGKTPLQFSKEVISDLDLNLRGKEGYMQVPIYKPKMDVIKYL